MEKRIGVYIHIPFCARKCGYCDFCSLAGKDHLMARYQHAILSHLGEAGAALSPYYIDTLYFGGGTPSFYGARRICDIFNALKRVGRVLKAAEVTAEINPESSTKRELSALRREGVNRLSVGVQSANAEILRLIGRRHNFKQAQKVIKNAREVGFDNISIDLIYGLPSQAKKDWADTLSRSLELRPEHISIYGLKLEEGTPMYTYKDSPFLPNGDEQADMYLYAVEAMERYGYQQYEISNFCLQGYESQHNLKYWNLQDYMGFGASAHSCVSGLRYSYISNVEGYISGVTEGGELIDEYEDVTRLDRAAEYIMLGMRTTGGISREEYYNIYRSNFDKMEDLLGEFKKRGWAKREGERWSFTSTGFLLSNVLIGALLEAQAEQKLVTTPWMRSGGLSIEKEDIVDTAGEEVFAMNPL